MDAKQRNDILEKIYQHANLAKCSSISDTHEDCALEISVPSGRQFFRFTKFSKYNEADGKAEVYQRCDNDEFSYTCSKLLFRDGKLIDSIHFLDVREFPCSAGYLLLQDAIRKNTYEKHYER